MAKDVRLFVRTGRNWPGIRQVKVNISLSSLRSTQNSAGSGREQKREEKREKKNRVEVATDNVERKNDCDCGGDLSACIRTVHGLRARKCPVNAPCRVCPPVERTAGSSSFSFPISIAVQVPNHPPPPPPPPLALSPSSSPRYLPSRWMDLRTHGKIWNVQAWLEAIVAIPANAQDPRELDYTREGSLANYAIRRGHSSVLLRVISRGDTGLASLRSPFLLFTFPLHFSFAENGSPLCHRLISRPVLSPVRQPFSLAAR